MKNILRQINILAQQINRPIVLMELCGTHTEAVARHGIKKLLPKNIRLLSGPGCPVCVTDQRDIDAIIALALEGVPIACYGDVLRVPGSLQMANSKWQMAKNISLNKARELGADVTEIYSVEDALKLREKKPNLVFFGLGFETTAPMTANAIKRGLTVYSSHKAFVPAMAALLATPSLKIDGFINPGHVSAIIGIKPYKKLLTVSENYSAQPLLKKEECQKILPLLGGVRGGIPQVIAGFEPEDILMTIYMLLKQIVENRAEVENEYTRLVRPEGNPKARKLINEVFEIRDAYWRGIGKIPNSGFEIRKKYSEFNAKTKYANILSKLYNDCHSESREIGIPACSPRLSYGEAGRQAGIPLLLTSKDILIPRDSSVISFPQNDINNTCICGAILRGLKEPQDCKLFNKKCTPDNPVGACMVSSEGACGIEAKFTPTFLKK